MPKEMKMMELYSVIGSQPGRIAEIRDNKLFVNRIVK